jgi:hypothetical protein
VAKESRVWVQILTLTLPGCSLLQIMSLAQASVFLL